MLGSSRLEVVLLVAFPYSRHSRIHIIVNRAAYAGHLMLIALGMRGLYAGML
jgi:hypothetical protein